MNQITNLADKRPSRPGPRGARASRPAQRTTARPGLAGRERLADYERCCDDVAERSLSMWHQVVRAVDAHLEPGRGAPSWVPEATWRDALNGAAAAGAQSIDTEARLGVIEDLTYTEALARHRLSCARRHTPSRSSTGHPWGDDLMGFRLRLPDQSVS